MEPTDKLPDHLKRSQTIDERIWIDSSTSKIDELLRINYDKTVKEFSSIILNAVADLVEALSAAFYVVDQEKELVILSASYACKMEKLARQKFELGEDLIGFAAQQKKIRYIEGLSSNNVVTSSSLAQVSALSLLILPLVFNDVAYGVLELNCIRKLEPKELELFERLSRNIASTLQSINNNEHTKFLLFELQEKTQQMEAQEEELRQNLEELHTVQEAMGQKQEELEQVKTKLEHNEKTLLRAMELAKKRDAQQRKLIEELEQRNGELEKVLAEVKSKEK